jgi:Flp pilus assembly protein TadB
MPDPRFALAAISAGAFCGGAVLVIGYEHLALDLTSSLARRRANLSALLHLAGVRGRLALSIERAGWNESPERVAVLAIVLAMCLGLVGATVSVALAVLGFIGGCSVFVVTLNAAIVQRRRRMSGELVPLLELFTLELSGGGSALAALGSVCVQVESELAIDLRRMLIATQVAGSASFESRLLEYSNQREVHALGSLATILAASRDYGTAASQGVRALATDLRRAQRRELIAQSRRALNNVLLPAAVAVLLPFLGVLMFPAVSVLQRSLR